MKRLLSIAILPLVMLLFYNQVANWHYHKLHNGIVVEHAHPFPNSKTAESPYENHTHTEFEFLIFGFLSSTIGLVVLLILIATLIFSSFTERYYKYSKVHIITDYLPAIHPHRGPPSYLK
jgi:predicted Na+-dependent transporter